MRNLSKFVFACLLILLLHIRVMAALPPFCFGKLSINLSDDVITPFNDGSFIVMLDGVESDYVIDSLNSYLSTI